jgi:hypothetical protein
MIYFASKPTLEQLKRTLTEHQRHLDVLILRSDETPEDRPATKNWYEAQITVTRMRIKAVKTAIELAEQREAQA